MRPMFQVRQAQGLVHLLRLHLAHGPGYTWLPPARYYAKPRRSLLYIPNTVSGARLASRNKFANKVAARKWEHILRVRCPWSDEAESDRSRLTFFDQCFKSYRYNEPNPSLYRTALGLRILEEIEKLGDLCLSEDQHRAYTYCILLEGHRGPHEYKKNTTISALEG